MSNLNRAKIDYEAIENLEPGQFGIVELTCYAKSPREIRSQRIILANYGEGVRIMGHYVAKNENGKPTPKPVNVIIPKGDSFEPVYLGTVDLRAARQNGQPVRAYKALPGLEAALRNGNVGFEAALQTRLSKYDETPGLDAALDTFDKGFQVKACMRRMYGEYHGDPTGFESLWDQVAGRNILGGSKLVDALRTAYVLAYELCWGDSFLEDLCIAQLEWLEEQQAEQAEQREAKQAAKAADTAKREAAKAAKETTPSNGVPGELSRWFNDAEEVANLLQGIRLALDPRVYGKVDTGMIRSALVEGMERGISVGQIADLVSERAMRA